MTDQPLTDQDQFDPEEDTLFCAFFTQRQATIAINALMFFGAIAKEQGGINFSNNGADSAKTMVTAAEVDALVESMTEDFEDDLEEEEAIYVDENNQPLPPPTVFKLEFDIQAAQCSQTIEIIDQDYSEAKIREGLSEGAGLI